MNTQRQDCEPEKLGIIGRALYGSRWQTEMARALEVGDRRVREWANGERTIPTVVWGCLENLLAQRVAECRALERWARHKSTTELRRQAMGL